MLGLVYAVLNLFGSYFSTTCNFFKPYFMVCVLYILHSVRKPLFVDEIDNHMEKSTRATVLSTTAQLKSLFLMIAAPVLGFVEDQFGIGSTMCVLAVAFVGTVTLLRVKN